MNDADSIRSAMTPWDTGPADVAPAPDLSALRRYRLDRVRAKLIKHDCGACVLFDPVNIRYATDSSNMTVWTLHNPARYCFIAARGPVILFEFHGCRHLCAHLDLIDEIRPARSWFYFGSGPRLDEHAALWAAEIADLLQAHCGDGARLAIDRCELSGSRRLAELGIEVVDGQGILEHARAIKSDDEIAALCASLRVAEMGMSAMHEALRPGMSEQQLWAILHHANIAHGGEWIETRLLTSGPRTNPWMQECGPRPIEAGDLVSFDTDMVGPLGYCADVSRSFLAGDGPASREQRQLYRLAVEQIRHNTELLEPGIGFRELSERSWPIPPAYRDNRYSCIFHGIGMVDEYPFIPHPEDFEHTGSDGTLESGMTVCVESYIGARDGREGVKLEEQVLITDHGPRVLSGYPWEERLLPPEW